MNQDYFEQYCRLQHESFCDHIKAVVEALEKVLELKGDQVTEQQRAAVLGLKAIYANQVVEDIKNDLASGHVTMETVEKRVRLEEDACKEVIERMSPSPMWKIFLELLLAEQINAMRANLSNLVLWMNNESK